MRRAVKSSVIVLLALACAGCGGAANVFNREPGYSNRFIAATASQIVIDYDRDSDKELDAAHSMAVSRCALFGKSGADLQSIDRGIDSSNRATFACH